MKYAHSSFFAAAILLLNIPATVATAAEPGTSCEFRPVLLEEFDEETAPNSTYRDHHLQPAWSGALDRSHALERRFRRCAVHGSSSPWPLQHEGRNPFDHSLEEQ